MKKVFFSISLLFLFFNMKAQTTTIAGEYKIVDIGTNGFGDFTRSLILLHEVFNGNVIEHNYAIGTITAMRGSTTSAGRINVVNVNTLSAYTNVVGTINAYDDDFYLNNTVWKLKTCIYAGKKYLAVEVPYGDSYHDWGFKFSGATKSTGENMKCVSYSVNGQPVNQNLISNIQDFNSKMVETHDVANLNITGNLGIGVNSTQGNRLAVNGTIHAKEVRIDLEAEKWPDYVFKTGHALPKLQEIESYIKSNGHLPGIPSAKVVQAEGVNVGEINTKLLEKIEELTLHMIEKDKEIKGLQDVNNKLENKLISQEETLDKILTYLKLPKSDHSK